VGKGTRLPNDQQRATPIPAPFPTTWRKGTAASSLPKDQQVAESLFEESLEQGADAYTDYAKELQRTVRQADSAEAFARLLREATLPRGYLGGVGNGVFGAMALAANAGILSVRRRRKHILSSARGQRSFTAKTRFRMTNAMVVAASDAIVEEYLGRNWELDFFRQRAFVMAHVDQQSILDELKEELAKVLSGGGTFTDFQDRAYELLSNPSPVHLEMVYRTNIQTALNAGKFYEGMDAIEELPYWEYVTVGDDRVRPAHAEMEGKIYRKDDPVWTVWFPPNGFNCRCSVVEWDDFSLKQERRAAETGGTIPGGIDIGFGQNAALIESLAAWAKREKFIERFPKDYGLGPLSPALSPQDVGKGSLGEIRDVQGQMRAVPETVITSLQQAGHKAAAEFIEATIKGPAEIWTQPGGDYAFVQTFDTDDGVRSVIVKVMGDVKDVKIVSGNADSYRRGVLLYRKN